MGSFLFPVLLFDIAIGLEGGLSDDEGARFSFPASDSLSDIPLLFLMTRARVEAFGAPSIPFI